MTLRAGIGAAAAAVAISVAAAVSSGASDGGLLVEVKTVTVPVANMASSKTPATVTCTPGSTLLSGGIRAFHTLPFNPSDPYHPINGLVVRGILASDSVGALAQDGTLDPDSWTALAGFAGQS